MRAVTRALPLLRPAHSLRIVRLPAGLDPDDLIRRDGAAAMERALAGGQSLLDTLWDHEKALAPLETPEDKAGLKARLLAHVETIGDPDIKALYRRELLKRFSEFAFPARDWSKHKNVVDIAHARRWAATQGGGRHANALGSLFVGGPSPELAARHANQSDRERHLHRRLGAAITAGLLRFPEYSMIYADTLSKVRDLDPRLDLISEATFDCDGLTVEFIAGLFTKAGLRLPSPQEWDCLRFPFAWPPSDDLSAAQGLEKAIRLYAGRQQIELALEDATKRLAESFSDENWQEQQRLLRRQTEFKLETRQIYQMAA